MAHSLKRMVYQILHFQDSGMIYGVRHRLTLGTVYGVQIQRHNIKMERKLMQRGNFILYFLIGIYLSVLQPIIKFIRGTLL